MAIVTHIGMYIVTYIVTHLGTAPAGMLTAATSPGWRPEHLP